MQMSMFSQAELRASHSVSRDCARDWLTLAETSCLPILPSLDAIAPAGWFGKMSPASCPATAEGILAPSSGAWANAGMGSPTECLTLSSVEHAAFPEQCPSDGAVSSLLDILETGDLPQRFFLTPKACAGILRRAEKRGKDLPEALHQALLDVSHQTWDKETNSPQAGTS